MITLPAPDPTAALERELTKGLKMAAPPPDMTVSEWADKFRVLSQEASAEPGSWRTDRAMYQRGIMDTMNDPAVETTVFVASSQVGKTELLNNLVGYTIDLDPAPIMVIQATVEAAERWSKKRLNPMLRDTPCLKGKVAPARSKNSDNTILDKQFPGGHITMVGSNSPAGLASQPIKRVLADEIDRYEASAGGEGDPLDLAIARTTTYPDRKIFEISSPTEEGISRIWPAYLESDQREYFIPCPVCKKFQTLTFPGLKIPKNEKEEYQPADAYYECAHCQAHLNDAQIRAGVRKGKWIASKPFNGTAGFRINQLYSPWVTLAQIATKFRKAEDSGSLERKRTFWNTVMGEIWKDLGEGVAKESLLMRAEAYTPDSLPAGVLVITAAVDVQDDRLEVEVKGWGPGFEGWGIEKLVLAGDPDKDLVWADLDELLRKTYQTVDGHEMRISTMAVDSGYKTQTVYKWCRKRADRRVFAVKGVGGHGKPLIMRPGRDKSTRAIFLPLGVDLAKLELYGALKAQPGPGYQHFPQGHGYDKEHFEQLTAEERHFKATVGRGTWVWMKKKGVTRNEALDLAVYNLCILYNLRPSWKALQRARATARPVMDRPDSVKSQPDKAPKEAPATKRQTEEEPPAAPKPGSRLKHRPRGSRGGWVGGY